MSWRGEQRNAKAWVSVDSQDTEQGAFRGQIVMERFTDGSLTIRAHGRRSSGWVEGLSYEEMRSALNALAIPPA